MIDDIIISSIIISSIKINLR